MTPPRLRSFAAAVAHQKVTGAAAGAQSGTGSRPRGWMSAVDCPLLPLPSMITAGGRSGLTLPRELKCREEPHESERTGSGSVPGEVTDQRRVAVNSAPPPFPSPAHVVVRPPRRCARSPGPVTRRFCGVRADVVTRCLEKTSVDPVLGGGTLGLAESSRSLNLQKLQCQNQCQARTSAHQRTPAPISAEASI